MESGVLLASWLTDSSLGQGGGKGLGIITSAMYVRRHFRAESKRQMDAMVQKLRAALFAKLDAAKWMDAETREAAKSKLLKMGQTIGYPEEMLDQGKVADVYRGMELTKGNFFESSMALDR